MSRRTILTFSTAGCLIGVYALYAAIVGPLFSPDHVEMPATSAAAGIAPNPVPPKNRDMAERYLAGQRWAMDAKYQVRTDEAYIYAGEWDRVDPTGDVRFKPFAMIVQQRGAPEKEPIVMFSDSALLKFASPFQYTNPKPGRIVGGALEGDVQIQGEKGLLVVGRNFNFSEAALRVWSDHPLKFASGPHRGSGMGLELDLIPGPPTADKPGVSGIRVVRIRKDVVMDLVASQKEGQFLPEAESDLKAAQDPVRITCDGAFEFALESHVATFSKNVRVNRPTGSGQADHVENVDLLTLVFEPAAKEAAAPKTPDSAPVEGAEATSPTKTVEKTAEAPAAGKLGDSLTFRRLRAEGRPVQLSSERSELNVAATEVTYDGQTRIVVLRDAGNVKAVQKMNDLQSPEITIEHDPSGKVMQAICRGAGRLDSYGPHPALPNERGALAMSAEWLKQLKKYPDSDPALDIVEFEGQAVLRQPEKMLLEGELIKIWVTAEDGRDNSNGEKRGSLLNPQSDDSNSPEPKRLLALERVSIVSPQLVGHTKRLEMWLEDGTLPPKTPRRESEPSEEQGTEEPEAEMAREINGPRQSSTRRGQNRTASLREKPGRNTGFAAVNDTDAPRVAQAKRRGTASPPPRKKPAVEAAEKPPVPVYVWANLIRVRATRDGKDVGVSEVWTEGNVKVTQARDPKSKPMQLEGDRMHLVNRSENDQLVHVFGVPAHIEDREMHIEGPEIFLDRGANTARVDGPGVLRFPVNKTPDGKVLDKPQMLDVWWKEQMQFDGLVAKFFVDVRANMVDTKMKCQVMEVTMKQRVSFTGDNPGAQKTEVNTVYCKEGVEVLNHEYQGNVLNSIRQAQAWEFRLNESSGDTTAAGPGALLIWRRGNGKRASLSPSADVQANRPLQAEAMDWEYTRVDFAGQMQGNTKSRNSTFKDRVRVVYGPVENTTAVVDADNLPKDGGWLRSDELQIKQQVDETTKKTHFELLGKGNAELEGRMFHALADQVSFDESKSLYVLRSLGTRMATIWRQKVAGGTTSRVDAQRMEFNPATNKLKTHQTSGLDGFE